MPFSIRLARNMVNQLTGIAVGSHRRVSDAVKEELEISVAGHAQGASAGHSPRDRMAHVIGCVDGGGVTRSVGTARLVAAMLKERYCPRRVRVGLACLLAVVAVCACRPAAPPPAPLQPDPAVTERRAREQAGTAEFKAAVAMTAAQVAELEAVLLKNPDDVATRKKLLVFYRLGTEKTIGWNERVVARRRHILWLITNRPADRAIPESGAISPAFDPAGYAQASALWRAATSAKDASPAVLGNAASFFWDSDKLEAERLLLRARAMDPGGPLPRVDADVYHSSWSARLGSLYVAALVGSGPAAPLNASPTPNPTAAERAFASEARRKLAETTDAGILVSAGQDLILRIATRQPEVARALGSDPEALGISYLERASRLDPELAPVARHLLLLADARQRSRRTWAMLKDVPTEKQPAIILALPDAERILALPSLVESSLTQADAQEHTKHDAKAAAEARATARAYAEDLLTLADRLPADPNRGTAIFSGHVMLGVLAMQANDMTSALAHMEAAGKAPPSEFLRYGNTFLWQRLATGMLTRGERESVARFLDRCAALNDVKTTRDQMASAAAAIRAGRMPEFFQYQTMPQ